jgi:hypothetical protein
VNLVWLGTDDLVTTDRAQDDLDDSDELLTNELVDQFDAVGWDAARSGRTIIVSANGDGLVDVEVDVRHGQAHVHRTPVGVVVSSDLHVVLDAVRATRGTRIGTATRS